MVSVGEYALTLVSSQGLAAETGHQMNIAGHHGMVERFCRQVWFQL